MSRADAQNSGRSTVVGPAQTPSPLWTSSVNSCASYPGGIRLGVVVGGDGTVFTVTDKNETVALSGSSGAVVWSVASPTSVCFPVCLAVSANNVVTFCDADGTLHAVDGASGSGAPLWKFALSDTSEFVLDVAVLPSA